MGYLTTDEKTAAEPRKKVTLATIHEKKEKGEKLARTALYDYCGETGYLRNAG